MSQEPDHRERRMRVAKYYNNKDLRLEEMQVPAIDPKEMLVRVIASGICGSDVMEWYRIKKAPLVLGHEISGDIVSVGQDVRKYKKGDRVFVSHHVPCNTCHYCLSGHYSVCDTLRSTNFDPGGFAEYVRVPEINVDRGVYILPEEVSYEEGAFIEPLACCVRGQRRARFLPGRSVLIIGSGLSGLLHLKLARASGAGRIVATDINDYRLECARQFGADGVVKADEDVQNYFQSMNGGRLADLVIVCTAALPAIAQAWRSVDRGGTILLFAPTEPGIEVSFPFWEIWRDGVTITTSYAGSPLDIEIAIELIRSRRVHVGEMITHRLGLAETGKGFELVAEAKDCMKIIIEPQR